MRRGLGGGQHVVLLHLCGAPGCQLRPARAVAEPHPAADAAHCAVLSRLCYSEPHTSLLMTFSSSPLACTPCLYPLLDPCHCAALKSSLARCNSQSASFSTMIYVFMLLIAKYQVPYRRMLSHCYVTVLLHERLSGFSLYGNCLQPRIQGSLGW